MSDYSIVERAPTIEEYQMLCTAVGWGQADVDGIQKSLRNSLYWVCLLEKDIVIGCGRVIGDGGLCFYIQDIIVLPPYQGQGLGRKIMEKVIVVLLL